MSLKSQDHRLFHKGWAEKKVCFLWRKIEIVVVILMNKTLVLFSALQQEAEL